MARGNEYRSFISKNREDILNFIDRISHTLHQYILKNKESSFVLFYKYLTHSDLGTFGKSTQPNTLDKNLLYYLTTEEMINIENKTKKVFQTAHQSCIGLTKQWYEITGLPQPRKMGQYLLNNYCNVYLLNENLKFFKSFYTQKIFKKLSKTVSEHSLNWDFSNLDIQLSKDEFTSIQLHCAVHGLGMKQDEDFHKLRHHLFKGDTFIILYEITKSKNNMFLLFEKNPIFYSLIDEKDKVFEDYQKRIEAKFLPSFKKKDVANIINERSQQSAWRLALAREMMGYTNQNETVFCPFTYIYANFYELSALFVASHIKGFSDPNTLNEERYDINNGLLLSSNADALFDKHLISVNKEKELVFSILLDNDDLLKKQLLLLQPIFIPILNDKRMKYINYHYQKFLDLEKTRKKSI
ncbi:HNH endonuclease signature motif containing protein [Mesomycoplasma hyorhinis]|uniref:HNH endonuclease signature motif containing protein n=1 Tax=Mesomycoplasma hyorhinis TaxID=2100 RepID=UPI001C03F35A|nr:HNH endonuclease signature motif containing protein [Mesomycoplasma hyorhinis]